MLFNNLGYRCNQANKKKIKMIKSPASVISDVIDIPKMVGIHTKGSPISVKVGTTPHLEELTITAKLGDIELIITNVSPQ